MKFQLYQPQAIYQLGQRSNQEDSIYPRFGEATADNRLFLVCDGMGGHDKGEVASAAVCIAMSRATEEILAANASFSDEQFYSVLGKTYDALDAADVKKEGKMGTTMTFLCLHKGGALVAHIGDSRIYHLRPSTGEVLFRSRDHSLVQQLYELGELSYNGMKTSPRKNVILRAMQPYQETRSKASLAHITDIRPGDYFYMCSDGMLEEMEDEELMSIITSELTDEEKVDELIRRTEENKDNHSAYLVRIKDVEAEAGDELYPSDEADLRSRNKALNDNHKDEVWDTGSRAITPAAGPAIPAAAQSGAMQGETPSATDMLRKYGPFLAILAAAIVACLLYFCTGKNSAGDANVDATEKTDSAKVKKQKLNGGKTPQDAERDQINEATVEDGLEEESGEPNVQTDADGNVIDANATTDGAANGATANVKANAADGAASAVGQASSGNTPSTSANTLNLPNPFSN